MPVTGQGTPYVVATDVVGAYPEVSRQLADAIDARNTAQDNTAAGIRADVNYVAARTDGWMRSGPGMQYLTGMPEGSVNIQTNNGYGSMLQSYGGNTELWHCHANTWHLWLRAYWATAGNNQMFVQSGAEWNLNNPNNFFAGTFFPSLHATQQPADEPLPRTVQLPADPQAPEGTYDLSATVLALAAQVEALQARITELEAQA